MPIKRIMCSMKKRGRERRKKKLSYAKWIFLEMKHKQSRNVVLGPVFFILAICRLLTFYKFIVRRQK